MINIMIATIKYLQLPEMDNLNKIKNYSIHKISTLEILLERPIKFSKTYGFYNNLLILNRFNSKLVPWDNIDKDDVFKSLKKLEKKTSFGYFEVNNYFLSERIMRIVATCISPLKVKTLVLDKVCLTDYALTLLYSCDFTALERLDLSNNDITNRSVKNLSKMVFTNNFQVFIINFTNIDGDGISIMANSKIFSHLKRLHFISKVNYDRVKTNGNDLKKFEKLTNLMCRHDEILNPKGLYIDNIIFT